MNVAVMPNSATANDLAIETSDQPGELPDSWSYVPLRSVCEKTSVWNPARERRDRFRYIDVSSVSNAHFCVTGAQEISGANAPSRARKIVKAGDVIYATVRPSLKRVAWIEPRYDDQIASTAFCIVRADPKQAVSRFLYYILLGDDVNRKIIEHERGASYPAVTDKDVLNQFVPLPPIDEQEKIAALLWKIQKAVEAEDAIVRIARDLKKSLLRRLFTHGLREGPLKETEIGPLPQSWETLPLIETVDSIDYGYSISIPAAADVNGVRIVSTADITKDGKLLYDQVRKIRAPEVTLRRLALADGDVLFNWRNSQELIGKTCVFAEHNEPYILASFVLRIRCGKKMNNYFLSYMLNFFREQGVFITLSRRAVGQANYNKNEISILPISVPPYNEQREIAGILQAVDRKIDIHESKKLSLQDLFKTMLHKLMTAQIRVNDLEIDTSELKT